MNKIKECNCLQKGKEVECVESERYGRIKIIDKDYENIQNVNGTIKDCIFGLRCSIEFNAEEHLNQFNASPVFLEEKKKLHDKMMKTTDEEKRMMRAGLPTDQIIFTA